MASIQGKQPLLRVPKVIAEPTACTFHWFRHHSPRKLSEVSTLKIQRNSLSD